MNQAILTGSPTAKEASDPLDRERGLSISATRPAASGLSSPPVVVYVIVNVGVVRVRNHHAVPRQAAEA
jgi:hypothetical protein